MSSGYRYLEEIATADAAFEAWGESPEELFARAADATMNVMVADLAALERRERRALSAEADELDLLLFDFLQEFVYYKDADGLLLRVDHVSIEREGDRWKLAAEAWGEAIDPERQELLIDVKAVTLHRFRVWQEDGRWRATVVLDT